MGNLSSLLDARRMYNLEAVSIDSFFTLHILNLVGITTPGVRTLTYDVSQALAWVDIIPGYGLA